MISFIKGTVEYIADDSITIENNNIGYRIFLSSNVLDQLTLNQEIKIYTYMNVREDHLSLYGFLSREEISIFNLLISVSTIGPKSALSILNTLTPNEIMIAIISDDFEKLTRCPGVGKKTAQRISLELKDKIKAKKELSETLTLDKKINTNTEKQDAIDALTALGYNRNESMKAVLEVASLGMTAEEIIKAGLKKLANI